jgi:hypothetical protein
MKEERKKQIKTEAERRLNLWLSNASFNEMTVYGSFIRFNIALGLLGGYPFEKEKWMNKDDFNGFVTEHEFDSVDYDLIIQELFYKSMNNCF